MSLLFDALKQAQQNGAGATQAEPQNAAPASRPAASVPPERPIIKRANPGGVAAAKSIMSATARPQRRSSQLLIGGLLSLLVAGLGGWYYLQIQLTPSTPVAKPIPLAVAQIDQETQPETAPPAYQPITINIKGKAFRNSKNAKQNEPAVQPSPAKTVVAPPPVHVAKKIPAAPAPRKSPALAVVEKTPATSVARKTPATRVAKQAPKIQMQASADPLKEGYVALTEGRLADAEAKYLGALAQHPHEKDVLLGLAIIAQRQKQTERALDYYQQVLSEDPNNVLAATSLFVLSEQADPVAAEGRLKQLLEIKPSSPEPHYALGNVLARQKRWGEAQQSFSRAYSLKPDNALYAYNLAVALDHLRKPVSALSYYEKTIQLAKPGDSTINLPAIQQRVLELNNAAP
ncbi:MAG: tetratricopeptide repeat protein [Sideroxydans sp.]|nr:tetratricopeptide repeat protein [Sideroxydans sp.]